MTIRRLVQAALMAGVVLAMAVSASAGTITYNTNSTGTGGTGFDFDATPLVLNSSSGTAATLTFTPEVSDTSGTPSGISFGHFILACPLCTTQAVGTTSATFSNFTFSMIVTDVTDNATGEFTGTATGGAVYSDVSPITINWAPLVLGPGGVNATTGSFGPTFFITNTPTYIVAPNSGNAGSLGRSSVQGLIDSTPEPATFSLIGGALLGLGLLGRKRLFRA